MPTGTDQLRIAVERNERWDVTRDAAMKKRVRSPPRYPICSETTHTMAATTADEMAEPLKKATAATVAQPRVAAGNSIWTLKRVPITAPISELQSAIMIIPESSFPGIIGTGD
jgi:hypothetical protein